MTQQMFQAPSPATTTHRSALIESVRRARTLHRASFDGTDPDVVRLDDAAAAELINRVARDAKRSIAQIIPLVDGRPPRDDFADLIWRQKASEDFTVSRIYLVPSGEQFSRWVRQILEEDSRVKVESLILPVGGGYPSAAVEIRHAWLIDDALVIRQVPGPDQRPIWLASAHESEVADFQARWVQANRSSRDPWPPEWLALTGLMLRSAPLLRELAPTFCTPGISDREPCDWYHGIWQYLRLFNMVSSPGWHAEFYLRELAAGLGDRQPPRVLVSGAADYSMLAHVAAAAGPREIDVHVADRCATALMACQWYGRETDLPVTVHEKDFSAPDCATKLLTASRSSAGAKRSAFDLVTTDAFLTRFTPAQAKQVVRTWSRLLRPDGRLVTTVRLHALDQPRHGGVTAEATDFVLRFREFAAAWQTVLNVDIEPLLEAARSYALRMTSVNLGERADVVRLVEENGFQVLHDEVVEVAGEMRETGYLRLVARKVRNGRN